MTDTLTICARAMLADELKNSPWRDFETVWEAEKCVWLQNARTCFRTAAANLSVEVKLAGAEAITSQHMKSMANYEAAIDCFSAMTTAIAGEGK